MLQSCLLFLLDSQVWQSAELTHQNVAGICVQGILEGKVKAIPGLALQWQGNSVLYIWGEGHQRDMHKNKAQFDPTVVQMSEFCRNSCKWSIRQRSTYSMWNLLEIDCSLLHQVVMGLFRAKFAKPKLQRQGASWQSLELAVIESSCIHYRIILKIRCPLWL